MIRPGSLSSVLAVALLAGVVLIGSAEAKRPAAKPARAKAPVAAKTDTTAQPRRVVAYYFHTNARCTSCRRLEEYSREAIQTGFAGEIKAGTLVWKVVNVEAPGNEHFVEDYQLATKSLVLVDETGGRQTRWKNCARVWQLLTDKGGFLRYVQGEVRGYLAGAS